MKNTEMLITRPKDAELGQGNCGVVAIAAATGVSYSEVWHYIDNVFNKRSNWKGGLSLMQIHQTLMHFNKRVGYTPPRKCDEILSRMTLLSFCKDIPENYQHKVMVVITTGHAQVVRGRQVLDQSCEIAVDVSEYHLRRKQVRAIFTIN